MEKQSVRVPIAETETGGATDVGAVGSEGDAAADAGGEFTIGVERGSAADADQAKEVAGHLHLHHESIRIERNKAGRLEGDHRKQSEIAFEEQNAIRAGAGFRSPGRPIDQAVQAGIGERRRVGRTRFWNDQGADTGRAVWIRSASGNVKGDLLPGGVHYKHEARIQADDVRERASGAEAPGEDQIRSDTVLANRQESKNVELEKGSATGAEPEGGRLDGTADFPEDGGIEAVGCEFEDEAAGDFENRLAGGKAVVAVEIDAEIDTAIQPQGEGLFGQANNNGVIICIPQLFGWSVGIAAVDAQQAGGGREKTDLL